MPRSRTRLPATMVTMVAGENRSPTHREHSHLIRRPTIDHWRRYRYTRISECFHSLTPPTKKAPLERGQ